MKYIGISFFTIGIIISVIAGSKVPAVGQDFPDTLLPFSIGVVFTLFGLVLWHIKAKEEAKAAVEESKKSGDGPLALLKSTKEKADILESKIESLTTDEICKEVDVILDTYVLPFAERRNEITTMFGMNKGAEILVTVAYGERMLNRIWSAASDEHKGEALKVMPEVVGAFNEANNLLEKLETV